MKLLQKGIKTPNMLFYIINPDIYVGRKTAEKDGIYPNMSPSGWTHINLK